MRTTKTITKTITVVETSTTRWLDKAKEMHGLSDYALAPLLGVTRGQISRYRNGHDFLSDDAAIKLAGLLGMDSPAKIIASAHAERAKTEEVKSFWEHLAGVAAGVLLAVGLIGTPTPSHASTASITAPLYIMSNYLATQGDRLAGLRGPHSSLSCTFSGTGPSCQSLGPWQHI